MLSFFLLDAGLGQVEVVILDPHGKPNTVPLRIRQLSESIYRCEYAPQMNGMHSVNVLFAGKPIPQSPFGVKVAPSCNPKKVRASGRGLQATGVRIGDIADFKVYTEGAGEGELGVKVTGPKEKDELVNIEKLDDFVYACHYKPVQEGKHVVTITYGGEEIYRSPFEVNIGPYKESKIKAYGPGLKGGIVGYPASFVVDTCGEIGRLGFTIEGPSEAKINCTDNGDGSANVSYYPTSPGDYAIHILSNKDDIPTSPYVAQILPKTDYDSEMVEASGPGLQSKGLIQNKPTEFTVDARKAGGRAPLDVSVMDKNFKTIEMKVKNNKNGTYKCEYTPESSDKHVIQVNYGGVAIPNSPFKVNVTPATDSKKVNIFGPGLEKNVRTKTSTHFTIDTENAGPGEPKVLIKDEKGYEIPCKVVAKKKGVYLAEYTPPNQGNLKVNVNYGGKPVSGCPIIVPVGPPLDVSKIKVEGLDTGKYNEKYS